MDEDWTVKSKIVSYGHDIEASWLLWEAAEVLEDESVMNQIRYSAIHLAESALAGLDQDNGLNYECNLDTEHLDQDKHWWVQAEAMVGFLNSYQLTDSAIFLQQSWQSWQFTKKHIIDHAKGEWFWGVTPDYKAMNDTKVGFWKCPYHNVRACLEVMHRLDKIKNQTFQVSKT
jgi:mannobiose 2-epimerase